MNSKFLPVLFLVAFSATAQNTPQPKDVREFLAVPTWYLSYKLSLTAAGAGEGSAPYLQSSWKTSLQRTDNGTVQLGIRTPGPSLSVTGMTQPVDEKFFKMINSFATWIGGIMPDKSKSSDEQSADLLKVLKQNTEAHGTFRFASESVDVEEPRGEMRGGTDTSRTTVGGSGSEMSIGRYMLEIDAEHKKYKLMLTHNFTSSPDSKAVTGEYYNHFKDGLDGSVREDRRPIEQGLHAPHESIVSSEPPLSIDGTADIIEGTLPDKLGNLSGSPSYSVRVKAGSTELKGTLIIQYVLSPKPPELVELIIEPPDDYENWRPLGGEDETTAADFVPIKVRLQKRGGGVPETKATRFKYRLAETSREKGVCMNWPLRPANNQPRDLQFEPARNADLDIGDNERQSASKDGKHMTEGQVVISCFDYGASSTFTAEAQLEDGRTILGTVKGTQREYLNLPERKTGSRIASVFFKDQGLGDLKDDDDSENDPVGDGFKGDGLTLYEEYRGFKCGNDWITTDPKSKDVFILNQLRGMKQVLRGIELFEVVTRLNTRSLLRDYQVNDAMVINFNRTDAPHVVDQHVIRILAGPKISDGGTAAFVEDVGTPGTAKAVRVPPDWLEFRATHGRTYEYFAATLAHEMLHDCNVWHHGEADTTVEWKYVAGPPAQVVEVGYGPITIKEENGSAVDPAAGFPDPAKQSTVEAWLGVEHGQHSGHEDCLMRYDVAIAYRSTADPSVRYLSRGESTGMGFCGTTTGTGVNSPGRRPQSRYGTAASGGLGVTAQRGKCQFQLRVNDLGQEPRR